MGSISESYINLSIVAFQAQREKEQAALKEKESEGKDERAAEEVTPSSKSALRDERLRRVMKPYLMSKRPLHSKLYLQNKRKPTSLSNVF